jgi:hypothetical protein
MGRWFFTPEATHEITRHGPIAVLELDLDSDRDLVVVGPLSFRSAIGTELDARALPPSLVSEAARELLGAVAAARN